MRFIDRFSFVFHLVFRYLNPRSLSSRRVLIADFPPSNRNLPTGRQRWLNSVQTAVCYRPSERTLVKPDCRPGKNLITHLIASQVRFRFVWINRHWSVRMRVNSPRFGQGTLDSHQLIWIVASLELNAMKKLAGQLPASWPNNGPDVYWRVNAHWAPFDGLDESNGFIEPLPLNKQTNWNRRFDVLF